MIGIAVIGYGYWGPNLVRSFSGVDGARVEFVVEVDESRLDTARQRYPAVRATTDLATALKSGAVDAVVVATDVTSHYAIALQALRAGRHVLVEKPFTATVDEATRLIDEAAKLGLVIMVDHPYIYTGAIRKIKDLMAAGELGELYYYDSVRANLGLHQPTISVVWDLAVHDLAILDYLMDRAPVAVAAAGASHLRGLPEDVAHVTLRYDGSFLAHVHASWLSPTKLRTVLLGGSRRMVMYDDLEPIEKLRVYDRGAAVSAGSTDGETPRVSYRHGDVWMPQLDATEALQRLAEHFVHCITSGHTPLTCAQSGRRIVGLLEAASESLEAGGRPVALRDTDG